MSSRGQLTLETRLEMVRGVGRERQAQLARLKLFTVKDLLYHRPRRYEDRRHLRPIAALQSGEAATVRGKVVALGIKRYAKGTKSVFELILDDGTARLHCRWWNLPFMEKYFQQGDEVFAYGKAKSLKPRTFDHPETEVIEAGEDSSIHINRITPIYPLTEGLPQRWLRGLVWRAVEELASEIEEPWPGLDLSGLPSRGIAFREIHFPDELPAIERARQRLAMDEFLVLQLAFQQRRRTLETRGRGLPCRGDNHLMKPFLQRLGFSLTAAQTRVLRELRHDMGASAPMRRLLQGDVGSGKTVVAACCALMALESGYNVALMAPTEVLAGQHFQTFQNWFSSLAVGVQLQTGAHKTAPQRPQTTARSIFIGTHALVESSFQVENLGLVIIDEQHKFGVSQREELVRKGRYPHLLIMTATPIPRTLGLTLYGDLDVSVIDEMPAQRGKIKTFLRAPDKLPKVLEFIRQKLAEGRQAYVVYPRVEEGDLPSGLKAVTLEFDNLREQFAPFQVGLLHGRLGPEEKESVMTSFRSRRVQVLLATSIIEVGLDVPNATVMLIENAEQFGLAQLHQLRGRIGRGTHDSFCILLADLKTPEARERLRVLEQTTDGFRIAEADLQLRGPGEFLGTQQSGLPPFRFGNLAQDLPLVERARALAPMAKPPDRTAAQGH
jgi:ATP-dependent DNA helicase RecG